MCAQQRPIVLAPRRPDAPVAASVAPGASELGVMLAVLAAPSPAARRLQASGAGDDERQRLRRADRLSRRRRAPTTRRQSPTCCSSTTGRSRPAPTIRSLRVVAAPGARRRLFLRRSRGYVPASLPLPDATGPPLLACGAELKNTFCLAKGGRAWVGHHIGDLAELRDADVVHRGDRALRATVRGRARGRRPRPAPGLPVDASTRSSATGSSLSVSSTTTRTWPRASPSTANSARRSERSSTGPATGPTGPSGAASCWSATSAAFRRAGHLLPVRLPGGEAGDPRAVADGVRVACGDRSLRGGR